MIQPGTGTHEEEEKKLARNKKEKSRGKEKEQIGDFWSIDLHKTKNRASDEKKTAT
jgi:hypothetical protein